MPLLRPGQTGSLTDVNSTLQNIVTNIAQFSRNLSDILSNRTRPAPPADNTIYISPTGSDSNDGTIGSPIKTWLWASQLIGRYDWKGNTAKIKVAAAGTFDFAANSDDGYYGNQMIVGAQSLPLVLIEGFDPNDPTQTILDDNGHGASGISLPPGSMQLVCFNGIQFSNFAVALNNQSEAGVIMPANSRFVDCTNITWDVESGGAIISGGVVIGGPPTIRFAGAHSQLIYCGGSWVDFDDAIVIFEPGCTFSYAIFNVANRGIINYHDNANQGGSTNPTGTQFFIGGNATIIANSYDQTTPLTSADMPGDADSGVNNGGFFNNDIWYSNAWDVNSSPTITVDSGSFNDISGVFTFLPLGKIAYFTFEINIVDVGTASGNFYIALPISPAALGPGGYSFSVVDRASFSNTTIGVTDNGGSALVVSVLAGLVNGVYAGTGFYPID